MVSIPKDGWSRRLRSSVSAMALTAAAALLAAPAAAQTAGAAPQQQGENPQQGGELVIEQIVVTGSRIPRPELANPIPVTTLNEQEIESFGLDSLENIMLDLPALTPDVTSRNAQNGTERAGVATANLRDLGTDRTLVLVDGKRVVSSRTGRLQVDLNSIPADFVERIEVLTGGASAIYGSDAMAGVVNIITRQNFEGLRLNLRGGLPQSGGEEDVRFSATAGGRFADGRAYALVGVEFFKRYRLASRQRRYAEFPLEIDPETNEPFFDLSTFTPGGRFEFRRASGGSIPRSQRPLDSDGDPVPPRYFILEDGTPLLNADNNHRIPGIGFNFNEFATISIPVERWLVAGKFRYEIAENTEFYFDGYFATTETRSDRTPETIRASEFRPQSPRSEQFLPITHPFVPDSLKQIALDLGLGDGDADPFVDDEGNPTVLLDWRRRLFEFGGRLTQNIRDTFRVIGGVKGDISERWHFDAYATYGRTVQAQVIRGNTVINNVLAALDIEPDPNNPGEFRCKDPNARARGCAPLNIFGFNSISKEALDWIVDTSMFRGRIEQLVTTAVVNGDLFDLPAGPVGFAGGVEYRKDRSQTLTDSLLNNQGTTFVAVPNNGGEMNVKEAFAEVLVPLVSGKKGVDYLAIEGAARLADYSTVGTVLSYKGGAEFAPVPDIRFRGTYSRAQRAPNILEAFSVPRTTAISRPRDPCDGVTLTTPGVVADNCRSIPQVLAAIQADGVFEQDFDVLVRGFNLGNPNLKEEFSDTYTAGFVLQPRQVRGLAITVDYWNIKINDAIVNSSRTQTIEACFNTPNLASPECRLIQRDGVGQIVRVDSEPRNQDALRTSGFDVFLRYRFNLDEVIPDADGRITITGNYTHVFKNQISRIVDNEIVITNERNEVDSPDDRMRLRIAYDRGPFDVSYRLTFIGGLITDNQLFEQAQEDVAEGDAVPEYLDRFRISPQLYHHITFGYEFGPNGRYRIFGGVNNLGNNRPPLITSDVGGRSSCNSDCSTYDPTGRRFFFGFRVRM